MNTSTRIDLDEEGIPIEEHKYRKLIGSLLYLTASGPDITYAVGVCARFQSKPKMSHYQIALKIIKYLKGTINVGLWCWS